MIPVVTAAQAREVEGTLMEGWGVPVATLVERAALGVAIAIQQRWPAAAVVVLAGTGSNGADALAVGRMLVDWGHAVKAFTVGDPSPVGEEQARWLELRGSQVRPWMPDLRLSPGTVLVDGLFGFGLSRPVEGVFAEAVAWANGQDVHRVAIDLPSGLAADTGVPLGSAIRAELTVASGLPKVGALADPGLEYVGELLVTDIGLPRVLLDPLPGRFNHPDCPPAVGMSAHKGERGILTVLAGSASMSGAPALVALAAARAAVGVVQVAVPAAVRDVVAAAVPEAIVAPLPDDAGEAWEVLSGLLARSSAVAAGPGLPDSPWTAALLDRLWTGTDLPLALDAQALNRRLNPYLLTIPRSAPAVLTPHPGEMARFLDTTVAEVQGDRLAAVLSLARLAGAVAVLKGARTAIATPDGTFWLDASGSAALATAGSGDVLTGIVGALLARGMTAATAARTGVAVHGRCGRAAGVGGRPVLARDLIAELPGVLVGLQAAGGGAPPLHAGLRALT